MCGHVGIAGDLRFKDEALIKRLLLFDFLRGEDGTGLAAVRKGTGKVVIAKCGSHPLELFDTLRFKEANSGFASSALIGHNRAATRGVKNSYNAHPYEFGRIVGGHNGTLENACTKELEDKLGEKFEVDSMAIFAAIDKFGIDETIPMLDGAWSLVWYDKDDNTINFIRNDKRPMWRAFSEDCKTMFWASEWPMLDAATSVVGHNTNNSPVTPLWHHPEKRFRFMQNQVDILYSYELKELAKGGDAPMEGRVKELKGKEPKPVVKYTPHVGGYGDPFGRDNVTPINSTVPASNRGNGKTTSTTTSRSNTTFKKALMSTVVIVDDPQKEPYGPYLSPERFAEIAKYGCSFCSADIEFGDEGLTILDKENIIICNECTGGAHTNTRVILPNLDHIK